MVKMIFLLVVIVPLQIVFKYYINYVCLEHMHTPHVERLVYSCTLV